ncbi:MAG: hypothetical protein KFW21_04810, partial [Spirochaetota bacterium]|nr:hypothetical protein [Spirochaetota bacterium]
SAQLNLNSLQYWNYVPKFVLDANPRVIQNLAENGGIIDTWIEGSGTSATLPTYDPGNTKDWVFNRNGRSVQVFTVVAGITNETASYNIQMIEDTSEFSGLFQLVGFGVDNGKFMIIDNTVALDANNAKAKYAIGNTIAGAKTRLNTVLHPNLFRKRILLGSIKSITAVAAYGQIVSIDQDAYVLSPSVNVLNKRDHTEWTFGIAADAISPFALVTTIVNGIPTAINYNLAMRNDDDTKGSFSILDPAGTGTYHGKFGVINIVAAVGGSLPYIIIRIFDTATAAESAYNGTVPSPTADTVYYKKTEIEENYKVIEIADLKNELVTLDKDNIYLNHEA